MSSRISLRTIYGRVSRVPDMARTGLVVSSTLITLFFTVSLTTLLWSAVVGALLLLASEPAERRDRRRTGTGIEPLSLRQSLGLHTTSLIALAIIGVIFMALFLAGKYTLASLTVIVLAAAALAAEMFVELVQRAQHRASSWLGIPEGAVEAQLAKWVAWAAPGEGRQ